VLLLLLLLLLQLLVLLLVLLPLFALGPVHDIGRPSHLLFSSLLTNKQTNKRAQKRKKFGR